MTIAVIKLITGEEIIGEIDIQPTYVTLTNVGVVQLVPTQTGVGMSLYPFAPYAEESKFSFKNEHIITSFEPSIDLRNNYNKMFGSGIQIASAGSLK